MIFKIILSTLHIFKSHFENYKVKKFIDTKKSHVFDDVSTKQDAKEDVFEVYYDDQGNDFRISKDNQVIKRFLGNVINKSAIKSDNMFRGFNLARLVEEQNLARKGTEIGDEKRLNFNNLAVFKALEDKKELEEKPSEDDQDEDEEFSSIGSPSPDIRRKN